MRVTRASLASWPIFLSKYLFLPYLKIYFVRSAIPLHVWHTPCLAKSFFRPKNNPKKRHVKYFRINGLQITLCHIRFSDCYSYNLLILLHLRQKRNIGENSTLGILAQSLITPILSIVYKVFLWHTDCSRAVWHRPCIP